tara:strand:+ start:377 stop:631 length:255 start_codon:yes stop_codon:yes gene_type:complete
MATIKTDNDEREVKDGEKVQQACEEVGVPFGCTSGICGTCLVDVEEGMEHLSEKTQEEKDMDLQGKERLMCQCKIKKGTIKIKF